MSSKSRIVAIIGVALGLCLALPLPMASAAEPIQWADPVDAPKKIDIRSVRVSSNSTKVIIKTTLRNLTKRGEFRFNLGWYESSTKVTVARNGGPLRVKSRNFFVGAPAGGEKCRGTKVRWKASVNVLKIAVPKRCGTINSPRHGVWVNIDARLGKKQDRARFQDWYGPWERTHNTLPYAARALNEVLVASSIPNRAVLELGQVFDQPWEFLTTRVGSERMHATDCFSDTDFESGQPVANCALATPDGQQTLFFVYLSWNPDLSSKGWTVTDAFLDV